MKRLNSVIKRVFLLIFSVGATNFRLLRVIDLSLCHRFCDFFWASLYIPTAWDLDRDWDLDQDKKVLKYHAEMFTLVRDRTGTITNCFLFWQSHAFSVLEAIRVSKYTWGSLLKTGHICPLPTVWNPYFTFLCRGQRNVHETSSINSI